MAKKKQSKRIQIILFVAGLIFACGGIYRSNAPKKLGEAIEIKYNPNAPEESTRHLEPTFGIVVSGIVGFIIFGLIGFRMIRSSLPNFIFPLCDTVGNKRRRL